MDELLDIITEESKKGYHCSNMLVKMFLEIKGTENPDLVAATSALAGGVGYTTRYICGCMSGGACSLGLFICKGQDEQTQHPEEREILAEFIEWFEKEIGEKYGSCVCQDIVGPDISVRMQKCPEIIKETYIQILSMLEKYTLLDL